MPSRRQPVVLCVNHWHDDNKGDSAISEATLRLIRRQWPAAALRMATMQERADRRFEGAVRNLRRSFPDLAAEPSFVPTELGSALPLSRPLRKALGPVATGGDALAWFTRLVPYLGCYLLGRPDRRSVDRLSGVDLLVLVGGSNVYDDPDVNLAFSLARLFTVLYPAWAAERLGVPVVVFGHTLGPFRRRGCARLARTVLAGAQRVFVREAASLDEARALGVAAVSGPDAAFAIEPVSSARAMDVMRRVPGDPSRTIVLVVRQHPHLGDAADDRVLSELATFSRAMLESGDANHILVVSQVVGPTEVEDDRALSRRLAGLLPIDRVTLVDEDLTPGEMAFVYGQCRLVVSVRLHAAILALAAGTPAYAIAYFTSKTEGVMRAGGLDYAWAPYTEVTARSIAEAVPRLCSADTTRRLRSLVATWRETLAGEVEQWPIEPSTMGDYRERALTTP